MPARVDDAAVTAAAQALMVAAQTITTEQGLRIKLELTMESARRHVMAALTFSLGHYARTLQPAGWHEVRASVSPEQGEEQPQSDR